MKFAVLATLAGLASAGNPVPVMPTLPGWRLGTPGGEIDVRVFYDLLCPDSMDAHYVWKDLLNKASPINGKTYGDVVDMRVTPFVLPYHVHSFQLTQLIPWMQDMCEADSTQCKMDQYAELTWKHW